MVAELAFYLFAFAVGFMMAASSVSDPAGACRVLCRDNGVAMFIEPTATSGAACECNPPPTRGAR